MIKNTLDPHKSINTDVGEIRFDLLAQAMSAHGEYVDNPADLEGALQRSIEAGKCTVIHTEINPVKHMWHRGYAMLKICTQN